MTSKGKKKEEQGPSWADMEFLAMYRDPTLW